jgi:hypothetical protein
VLSAPGATRWLMCHSEPLLSGEESAPLLFASRSFLVRNSRFLLLRLPLSLPPGLPAVGNLGQEFADMFDFILSPRVKGAFSSFEKLWGWHLLQLNVARKRLKSNSQPLGRFTCRIKNH